MKLFSQVNAAHTGNGADKWQHYLNAYDEILKPFQGEDVSLLEVGVCNGGSLEIWERYFPYAQHIVGCDINSECQNIDLNGRHIDLVIGDVKNHDTVQQIAAICPQFDIILDDGSHLSSDIIAAFVRLFPLLKEDGIYIVEDLCCSYWHSWEGGVSRESSSMQFLKLLADVVNYEHWDVSAARADLFQAFAAAQGIEHVDLSTIHSVTFSNSMCVIRKKAATNNILGKRMVVGDVFHVLPHMRNMHGTYISDAVVVHKKDEPIVSDTMKKLHQQEALVQQQQAYMEQQQAYIEQLVAYAQKLEQHIQAQSVEGIVG